MIRFNVLYPNSHGARFDHGYYERKHMPLVARLLGPECVGYSVERGLAGRQNSPSPFVASCSVLCTSLDGLRTALAANGAQIAADIKNYTDLQPVVWIGEVTVDETASSRE